MRQSTNWLKGLAIGIAPHTFCILFIVFSVVGATAASAIMRKFLLIPHIFPFMIAASVVCVIIFAVIYLKRTGHLCACGVRKKWRYLTILAGTTILTNTLLMFVIFPAAANGLQSAAISNERDFATVTLTVGIPCSGHAPLIIDELAKVPGILNAQFEYPRDFKVRYDSAIISVNEIRDLPVFQTFKLTN